VQKSQIGIEKSFSFLNHPAIVNSIFLKKAERIEVLSLVLLVSLLIWWLTDHSMRQYVEANGLHSAGLGPLTNEETNKSTVFMI
jgi:transposase